MTIHETRRRDHALKLRQRRVLVTSNQDEMILAPFNWNLLNYS